MTDHVLLNWAVGFATGFMLAAPLATFAEEL